MNDVGYLCAVVESLAQGTPNVGVAAETEASFLGNLFNLEALFL